MWWSHELPGGDRSPSDDETITRAIKFGRNSQLKLWVIYPPVFFRKKAASGLIYPQFLRGAIVHIGWPSTFHGWFSSDHLGKSLQKFVLM